MLSFLPLMASTTSALVVRSKYAQSLVSHGAGSMRSTGGFVCKCCASQVGYEGIIVTVCRAEDVYKCTCTAERNLPRYLGTYPMEQTMTISLVARIVPYNQMYS